MWTSHCACWVTSAWSKAFCYETTVHKDVTERLPKINSRLYKEVKSVLEKNKQERHIRGGMATKRKYAKTAATPEQG